MEKVNINEKFMLVNDYWSPKIAGEINDIHVKFAKLKGEFVWHCHDHEDEMFLVVKESYYLDSEIKIFASMKESFL